MAKKKPVIKKPVMNKFVKLISKKQNAKKKLNAGQIREVIKIFMTILADPNEAIETEEFKKLGHEVLNGKSTK